MQTNSFNNRNSTKLSTQIFYKILTTLSTKTKQISNLTFNAHFSTIPSSLNLKNHYSTAQIVIISTTQYKEHQKIQAQNKNIVISSIKLTSKQQIVNCMSHIIEIRIELNSWVGKGWKMPRRIIRYHLSRWDCSWRNWSISVRVLFDWKASCDKLDGEILAILILFLLYFTFLFYLSSYFIYFCINYKISKHYKQLLLITWQIKSLNNKTFQIDKR